MYRCDAARQLRRFSPIGTSKLETPKGLFCRQVVVFVAAVGKSVSSWIAAYSAVVDATAMDVAVAELRRRYRASGCMTDQLSLSLRIDDRRIFFAANGMLSSASQLAA